MVATNGGGDAINFEAAEARKLSIIIPCTGQLLQQRTEAQMPVVQRLRSSGLHQGKVHAYLKASFLFFL